MPPDAAPAPDASQLASTDTCSALLIHLITLELDEGGVTSDAERDTIITHLTDTKRAPFLASCTKTSQARVDCALAAGNLKAAAACDEPPAP